jgi:hypothetical protein
MHPNPTVDERKDNNLYRIKNFHFKLSSIMLKLLLDDCSLPQEVIKEGENKVRNCVGLLL